MRNLSPDSLRSTLNAKPVGKSSPPAPNRPATPRFVLGHLHADQALILDLPKREIFSFRKGLLSISEL